MPAEASVEEDDVLASAEVEVFAAFAVLVAVILARPNFSRASLLGKGLSSVAEGKSFSTPFPRTKK